MSERELFSQLCLIYRYIKKHTISDFLVNSLEDTFFYLLYILDI